MSAIETETPENVEAEKTAEDVLEALDPKYTAKEWTVRDNYNGELMERTYTQRPLSFIGKLEFFGLLGSALQNAMKDGVGLNEVMKMQQTMTAEDSSFDEILAVIAQLAQHVPDLVLDSYCSSMAVPQGERPWVKDVWSKSEAEGGLSDEDGIEILEIFVEQNTEALKDFFDKKLRKVGDRMKTKFQASGSSKPSKRTRPRTPKA